MKERCFGHKVDKYQKHMALGCECKSNKLASFMGIKALFGEGI